MNPFEYVHFRERKNAHDLAIVAQGRFVTFGELGALVRGAAAKLRRQGIEPGQSAAIYVNEPIAQWVITLALAHEGAVSCSAHPNFEPMPTGMPVDVYIAERLLPFMSAKPTVLVEQGWLRDCAEQAEGVQPRYGYDEDEVGRIISSSGTTGVPKAIPLSHAINDRRIRHANVFGPAFGPMLCMMTLSTYGGFNTAGRALATGFPLFFSYAPNAVIRSITAGCVTDLTASPAQLEGLVKFAAPRSIAMPSLRTIISGGAALPRPVLNRIRAALCPNVMGVYASTETGTSARAPAHLLEQMPGCAGFVDPGIEVEIVGDDDLALPDGQEGAIRIRSNMVTNEYMGDPEESARAFRNGWFYPGDLGRYGEHGLLQITGRVVEVINMGGTKVNPVLIDEFLPELVGVRDGAAFGIEGDAGNMQIWAAVVADASFDESRLLNDLRAKFGGKSPSRVFKVDSIPRNNMGKTQRGDLRAQVLASVTRH